MLLRKAILDNKILQQRLIHIKTLIALAEITNLHAVANLRLALKRSNLAQNSTQKRRLACAVRA